VREIKQESWSIVIRGDLNPRIFQPSWFAMQNLLGHDEAESAKLEVVHPEVTHFSVDWVDIQVLRDRFAVRTLQEGHAEAMRDLVMGTFRLLRHTPAGIMGINKTVHFSVDNRDEWNAIGHALVPKSGIWNDTLKKPGTRAVLVQGERPDEFKGYVLVRIEPSPKVQPGVFIEINDHYNVTRDDKAPPPAIAELMKVLEQAWVDSVARADATTKRIMEIR